MAVKMVICKAYKIGIIAIAFGLTAGCQSANQQMNARIKDNTYPDLLAVPPAPNTVRTDKDWSELASDLAGKEKSLRSLKAARDFSEDEWDKRWADKAAAAMEKNPKNGPIPNMDEALAWAARLRAKMEKHKN